MNDDVLAAYDWVRRDLNGLLAKGKDESIINDESVGVTGDSAGGYLSLMLGVTAQPPLKACCPFYGLSDLSTLASGHKVRIDRIQTVRPVAPR
jgi:acetyl esterase/lipase